MGDTSDLDDVDLSHVCKCGLCDLGDGSFSTACDVGDGDLFDRGKGDLTDIGVGERGLIDSGVGVLVCFGDSDLNDLKTQFFKLTYK